MACGERLCLSNDQKYQLIVNIGRKSCAKGILFDLTECFFVNATYNV